MALPAFIQAVYGGILQLNYSMDSAVSARTDLITFRTPKPMTAARLTEIAGQLHDPHPSDPGGDGAVFVGQAQAEAVAARADADHLTHGDVLQRRRTTVGRGGIGGSTHAPGSG